jgi:hypothetical protein
MKTLQDLKNFYNATLLPKLRILEEERKSVVRKLAINFIVIWGLLGISYIYFFYQKGQRPLYAVLLTIICFYIWHKKRTFLRSSYVSVFKNNVIAKIVGFVDERLKYSASCYIDESDFIRSHIFNIAHDVYAGDDYVCGKIGETEIEFSELYSGYKVSTRGGTYCHTIFKGLFFIADFNKNFSGKTIILPDKAEKLLGRLGRTLQSRNKKRGQLIKLEDPEFEKYFVVYGDDQVQARYILSTSLMRHIADFKKNTKRHIYLSFIDSKICVAISYTKDLFEPKLYKTLLDFKPIQEYFEDLQLVISIVNDLNLNTRIWTKL